jgi:hypothetical protein
MLLEEQARLWPLELLGLSVAPPTGLLELRLRLQMELETWQAQSHRRLWALVPQLFRLFLRLARTLCLRFLLVAVALYRVPPRSVKRRRAKSEVLTALAPGPLAVLPLDSHRVRRMVQTVMPPLARTLRPPPRAPLLESSPSVLLLLFSK